MKFLKIPFTLLLTLLYLSTALGIDLTFHYCFGQVSSVHLYTPDKPGCKLLRLKKLPDCCKSRQLVLKVKDNHQPAVHAFAFKCLVAHLAVPLHAYAGMIRSTRALRGYAYRGPPDRLTSACPVFLKNCTFRI